MCIGWLTFAAWAVLIGGLILFHLICALSIACDAAIRLFRKLTRRMS